MLSGNQAQIITLVDMIHLEP